MEKFQIYSFTALFLAVIFLSLQIFLPFLVPVSIAATFAILFNSINERLAKIFGGRRGLSALLTVALAILIIVPPLAFIGEIIISEAISFSAQLNNGGIEKISAVLASLQEQISNYFPGSSINLKEYLQAGAGWLSQNIGAILTGVAKVTINLFIDIFIFIVSFYYFLKDGPKVVNAIVQLSPLPDKHDYEILTKLESAVNSVVKGSLIIAVVQGTLASIGLIIFGVPNPALLGTAAAITSLIPGVGTALIMVPAIAYLFLVGSTGPAIGLLIWQSVVVGLVDNILAPILIGKGIKLHPLLILISVMGGLIFFGAVGFLLGPVVLSLLFAMIEIYKLIAGVDKKVLGG